MLTPLLIYAIIVLAILVVFCAIVLVNLAVLPTLGAGSPAVDEHPPRVAVLIPARNEQANIEASLRSLLLQERVRRLDSLLHPQELADADNPVARQIGRISAALNVPRLP